MTLKAARSKDETIDRLWQIITLLSADNFDLLERLCIYEPFRRGDLWELANANRRIAQKVRRMLEKEGIDVDKAIAEARARFEANPLGFDIVGHEDDPPWVPLPPRRFVHE
jgi:hypothetical protein